MTFDPCGRFVDFRRAHRRVRAQFGADFDLMGWMDWYRCAETAKGMPFLHIWLNPDLDTERGEPREGAGPLVRRTCQYTAPIVVPPGDHHHGTEEQWLRGITQEEWNTHLAAGGPGFPECLLQFPPCHAEYPGFIWAACGRRTSFGRRQHCCALPRVLNAGWEVWGSSTTSSTARLFLQTRPYGSLGPITTHDLAIPVHGGNSLGYLLYAAGEDTEIVSQALYDPIAVTYFVNLGVKDPSTLPSV